MFNFIEYDAYIVTILLVNSYNSATVVPIISCHVVCKFIVFNNFPQLCISFVSQYTVLIIVIVFCNCYCYCLFIVFQFFFISEKNACYFIGVKLISQESTSKKRISEGKVKVYDNGKWSTICAKDWTKDDADVTCKDLGFSSGAIENLTKVAQGNETAVSKAYRCTGEEEYLIKCPRSREIELTCASNGDAAVRCKDEGNLFNIY